MRPELALTEMQSELMSIQASHLDRDPIEWEANILSVADSWFRRHSCVSTGTVARDASRRSATFSKCRSLR